MSHTGRTDWGKNGLCKNYDTELFYPEPGQSEQSKKACSICKNCPVRIECLTEALVSQEQFGVWGGFTIRQRRKIANALSKNLNLDSVRRFIENVN